MTGVNFLRDAPHDRWVDATTMRIPLPLRAAATVGCAIAGATVLVCALDLTQVAATGAELDRARTLAAQTDAAVVRARAELTRIEARRSLVGRLRNARSTGTELVDEVLTIAATAGRRAWFTSITGGAKDVWEIRGEALELKDVARLLAANERRYSIRLQSIERQNSVASIAPIAFSLHLEVRSVR